MLRRLLTHILIVVTLAAPVLMHGGSWLSSPAHAGHHGASPAQNQSSHCPQHQSKDSNCCPQCVGWLAASSVDSKKTIVFTAVSWLSLEALAPSPLLVGEGNKRDDGGGYASARLAFEAFFARTSRLLI